MQSSHPTPALVSYRIVSPSRMSWLKATLIVCAWLFVLVLVSNVVFPQIASGQTLTGAIILGFNERYGQGDTVHWGADVALPSETALFAPVAGTVSYVGSVPAAAPAPQSVVALTITTEQGYQVSVNPLASTSLRKGDRIEKGQRLGTLSQTGDPSSAQTHVHLSLRIEGVYRDPGALIGAVIDGSAPIPFDLPSATKTQPSPATGTPPQNQGATATVPSVTCSSPILTPAVSASEEVGAPAPAPTPSSLSASSVTGSASPAGTVASGEETAKRAPVSLSPAMGSSPMAIQCIPGVTSFPSELSPDPDHRTVSSRSSAWFQTLSTTQVAGVFYAIGLVVPGIAWFATASRRRLDATVLPIGMHLFATREEK